MTLFWTIISAIGAFIATNIDDIFVLMLFFSQVKTRVMPDSGRHIQGQGYNLVSSRDIVIGQYLGFVLLVALSLLGTFGLMLIPEKWVGLLGLVPIYLGIKLFIQGEDDEEDSIMAKLNSGKFKVFYLNVAFVTFANGGDNIGIYVPFFSTLSVEQIIITVITFLVMVAVWCYLGFRLARFRHVSETLEKYGRWIVPIVFVGLGIYIMLENDTFSSIYSLFK